MENNKDIKKKNKVFTIAKFGILLVFIVVIPVYVYFFQYDTIANFHSLYDLQEFLLQHERTSIFVYIGILIICSVVFVIPGSAFHVIAGFVFGFWFGYIFSVIGIILGSIVTFYLARILGKDAMVLFFGEERFAKFINRMNSKRGTIVVFFMYLFPGFPKEGLGYPVGLSRIKLIPFLLIVIIGRTPALKISLAIGSMYHSESYLGIIIIVSILIITMIAFVVNRKKIMETLDKWFDNIASES